MSLRLMMQRPVASLASADPRRRWPDVISRRALVRRTTGVAGVALASGLLRPDLAAAAPTSADPRPIPGGITPFGPGTELYHVVFPARDAENATITDFDGVVGVVEIDGTGTGTDTKTGATSRLRFDGTDVRFMQGTYVGMDGKRHQGTWALI